jgi:hypothetical protein
MNLSEKIEKIRKEPEHIRLRYIWLAVFISMFLIVMLWILSLQTFTTKEIRKNEQPMTLDSFSVKNEK